MLGLTASATFESNVHGVVVQAKNKVSRWSDKGNFTKAASSVMVSYPWATSCVLSAVPQRDSRERHNVLHRLDLAPKAA